jgi:hypothetical protein
MPVHEYIEILRLMTKLDDAKIPYEKMETLGGWVVHYPTWENPVCSAIEHIGSYGHADDLIEICGLLTDSEKKIDVVKGWLTADDVFGRIEKHFKEREV